MKSSDRRGRVATLTHLALGVVAVAGIAMLRAPLAGRFATLKTKADTYLLPSADLVVVGSLGYRSALADFIFAHVLVSHGLHFGENRLFTSAADYLEAINALDPKFRDPYHFADTLITMQPKPAPASYYRRARKIQERGLKELPYDQELWLTTGQFLAYLGGPRLNDPAERDEWRRTGARYLMRACDLIGSNENIPFHCVTAASLLNEEGDRDAARSFLERVLNMSQDPELRDIAQNYLNRLDGRQVQARVAQREQRRRAIALRDGMLFATAAELDALGPATDTTACAGNDAEQREQCASSWRRLVEHDQPQADATR